jgi:hypothetical protein
MTIRIDARTLADRCGVPSEPLCPAGAARLVELLGWLSQWWLPCSVLETAATQQPAYRGYTNRPRLPSDPGGCWVIFVCPRALPSLRPAFLLPLCWCPDVKDDPHLPIPMRELAERIRGQVPDKDGKRWGLWLARPEGDEPRDLSGLHGDAMGVSSGWAALAGGLLLARGDGVPDVDVWASAAWHEEYGIGAVEALSLSAKLDLAAEWKIRQMFVPAQNQSEVDQWRNLGGSVNVELLTPMTRRPDLGRPLEPGQQVIHQLKGKGSRPPALALLLERYLDQIGTEPRPEESFNRRYKHYSRVSRRRANDFYFTHLLDDVVERCREHTMSGHPYCRPTHLVTVVSNQPAVVALAPRVLEAKHCLVLHEDPPDKLIQVNRNKVMDELSRHGVTPVPAGVRLGNRADELVQMETAVADFARGVPSERLAFDLTPGYKFLNFELEELAPAGSWLLYCRHEQMEPDDRVDPGTEHYDCWQQRNR